MKQFVFILFLLVFAACGSDKGLPARKTDPPPQKLLFLKKYFDAELKPWSETFYRFSLSEFSFDTTVRFGNTQPQEFATYTRFRSIYGPILTWSADSTSFIDIYSAQLNLIKKGSWYEASPDVDGPVMLCDRPHQR